MFRGEFANVLRDVELCDQRISTGAATFDVIYRLLSLEAVLVRSVPLTSASRFAYLCRSIPIGSID